MSKKPKHGHKRGWRRWKARAAKRSEWIANEINRLTKEMLEEFGDVLIDNVFGGP